MKNALKNPEVENMYGLLVSIFMQYANDLRRRYRDWAHQDFVMLSIRANAGL